MNSDRDEGSRPASYHDPDYDEAPLVLTWEVSQACELSCEHCRADAQPERHPAELTTEDGKRLIDGIAAFGSAAPILVLSGGDPLERPDLFGLLEAATETGLRTAVAPAPTSSLTAAVLERFAAVGVDRISLSLDGATANSHDRFRGTEGSFERIREAAMQAAEVGLPIQINTTVTGRTVEELPGIADLVAAYDAVAWEVFFLVPTGRGRTLEQLRPAAAERTLAWLYDRQRTADFRLLTVEAPHYRRIAGQIEQAWGRDPPRVGSTGDGRGFAFVSHTGEVYPSGFLPLSAGNVRRDDLVGLYRSSPLFAALRDPDRLARPCGTCPYRETCGGSRARAFAMTGDPLGSDPLCARVARHKGAHGEV